jgi:hypothetical protein
VGCFFHFADSHLSDSQRQISDQVLPSTSPTFGSHAARNTLSGMQPFYLHRRYYEPQSLQSRCYPNSLDALEFKPTRNQRRALNRWTRYVLGEQYIRETATLYPRSKKYVKMLVVPARRCQSIFNILNISLISTLLQDPLYFLVWSWKCSKA